MVNIFDLKNLGDLSDEVKRELKVDQLSEKDQKILDLFSLKSELNIDEILVGLARKYSIKQKRSWISNRLYALSKLGKIEKIAGKKGRYKKI